MNPFRFQLGFIVTQNDHIMTTSRGIDAQFGSSVHRRCNAYFRSQTGIDFDDVTVSSLKRIFWLKRFILSPVAADIYSFMAENGFLDRITDTVQEFLGATLISGPMKTMIEDVGGGATAEAYEYQPTSDEKATLDDIFQEGAQGILATFNDFHNEAWKRPDNRGLQGYQELMNTSRCFSTVNNDPSRAEIADEEDAAFLGIKIKIGKQDVENHFASRDFSLENIEKQKRIDGSRLTAIDQLLLVLYLEQPESNHVWMVV